MHWRFNGKIIGKGGKRWENPIVNGRFIAGKIIELNGVFSVFSIAMSAMCHYQRVNVMNYTMLFKVLDPPQFYPFYQFSMHRELYVYENMEQKQVCKKEENIHSCFRNPVHSNSRVRKPMSVAFTTDPAPPTMDATR